jgi:hypothetical protein
MKDVMVIVVNGQTLAMPFRYNETIGDVAQCAIGAMKYANSDAALNRWEFLLPNGEILPRSMPVRELSLADDTSPDLILSLRAGVAA